MKILSYMSENGEFSTVESAFFLMEDEISKVCLGEDFGIFLTSSNKVYSFGTNSDGVLGLDKDDFYYSRDDPVRVSGKGESEKQLGEDVSCGKNHALMIEHDGHRRLKGWGRNFESQLGSRLEFGDVVTSPTYLNETLFYNLVSVSAGTTVSCVRRSDFKVFCFGGTGNEVYEVSNHEEFQGKIIDEVYVIEDFIFIVSENEVYQTNTFSSTVEFNFTRIIELSGMDIVEIIGNSAGIFVRTAAGEVYSRGTSISKYICRAGVEDEFLQVSIGVPVLDIAVSTQVNVFVEKIECHGENEDNDDVCGGVGVCRDVDSCLCPPEYLDEQCLAKKNRSEPEKNAFYMGNGVYNEAGEGANEEFGMIKANGSELWGKRVMQVGAGSYHLLFSTDENEVFSIGRGTEGQLGSGSNEFFDRVQYSKVASNSTDKVFKMCGGMSSSAVLRSSGLWLFGTASTGFFGSGFTDVVSEIPFLYDSSNYLPMSARIVNIECNLDSLFLLLSDNSVYSSGFNQNGELGHSSYADSFYFERISGISLGENDHVEFVSSGFSHTCVVSKLKELFCWGKNSKGQIANGGYSNQKVPVRLTSAVNGTIRKVFAVGDSTFVVTEKGTLFAAGSNEYGNLGLNSSLIESSNDFVEIPMMSQEIVQSISNIVGTDEYTVILTENGMNANRLFFSGMIENVRLSLNFTEVDVPSEMSLEFIAAIAGNMNGIALVEGYKCNNISGNEYLTVCGGYLVGECNQGNCFCVDGVEGNDCEIGTCFGKLSNSSEVCGGNGNCTINGECLCVDTHEGSECATSLQDQEDLKALIEALTYIVIVSVILGVSCIVVVVLCFFVEIMNCRTRKIGLHGPSKDPMVVELNDQKIVKVLDLELPKSGDELEFSISSDEEIEKLEVLEDKHLETSEEIEIT